MTMAPTSRIEAVNRGVMQLRYASFKSSSRFTRMDLRGRRRPYVLTDLPALPADSSACAAVLCEALRGRVHAVRVYGRTRLAQHAD